MRVILTVANPARRARLENRLRVVPSVELIKVASNLMEAHQVAEQFPLDIAVFSGSVTGMPGFEVLTHLLDARKVGIALFVDGAATAHQVPATLAKHPVALVSEDMSDDDLLAGLGTTRVFQVTGTPLPAAAKEAQQGQLIMIGASTGGVEALIEVLSNFGRETPPTMIVQHTGGSFSGGLAKLLDSKTEATVREAEDGLVLQRGMVVIGPGDKRHLHARVTGNVIRCRLVAGAEISGHRPSVDALFRSGVPAASRIAAAILTGMGKDGAEGLLALRNAGARTFGQNQETSLVYGMPRMAKQNGAVERQLPLEKIGPALIAASLERSTA